MSTKQKFKLSLTAILSTVISITTIAILWMVLTNNPTNVSTTIDFHNQKIELNCTFVEENIGETTPNSAR